MLVLIQLGRHRQGKQPALRKIAAAEKWTGLCKVKQSDLPGALVSLTKAVNDFIAGSDPAALLEAWVKQGLDKKDGVNLYKCDEAKEAVDYAAFINTLPDVKGAKLDEARRLYIILKDMIFYRAWDDFGNESQDKRNEEGLSLSAPIRCRLGDVDRRLSNWTEGIGYLNDAQLAFGRKPEHILDQMKIALAKGLLLKEQSDKNLPQADKALTDGIALKSLDPILADKLGANEDEAKIRRELHHVRAQVRWHEGQYWDALTDQFSPQS